MVHDARKFIFRRGKAIEQAPLQVYCSALVFSPTKSIVRQQFLDQIPSQIQNIVYFIPWLDNSLLLEDMEIKFSPNKHFLATGLNNIIKLWNPTTGALYNTLKGHTGSIREIQFSPNNHFLACTSQDHIIRLWDPETGALQTILQGHTKWVLEVLFSPDNQLLASVSYDNTVRLWDPKTGALKSVLEGHTGGIHVLAFSPDSRFLASAAYDTTVRLWDLKSMEMIQIFDKQIITCGQVSHNLSFSADGLHLFVDGQKIALKPHPVDSSQTNPYLSCTLDNPGS
ncbi:MAG: hypothetical protein M1834_004876 [Cirrosporium novae-zelandiae]|nr:MAG: hypothetical protein M1834_004876 [Cirrosporium novae-zelandiae]